MGSRIISLLAVLVIVLVTGCKSTPPDNASISTDSGLTAGDKAPISDTMADAGTGMPLNGATPGTQQDLVVNVGDRVFFGYDKYDLSPEARATIEKQAQWLKQYPHLNISIEGHCDERGTREYNLALGEKRANSEKSYLIALGVEASRIQTISYGKERPAVTGSDESSWAQNRRAVAVVQ